MVKGLTKEQQIKAASEMGGFLMRPSYESAFYLMSGDESRDLMLACLSYFSQCEEPNFDMSYMQVAWEILKSDIDDDISEYINNRRKSTAE